MFTFEFHYLDVSVTVNEDKLPYWPIFKISAKVRLCDLGQNFIMTRLLNSVPFIKKTLVNHVYIRI